MKQHIKNEINDAVHVMILMSLAYCVINNSGKPVLMSIFLYYIMCL